jgi:hypothetical protein
MTASVGFDCAFRKSNMNDTLLSTVTDATADDDVMVLVDSTSSRKILANILSKILF